MNNRNLGRRLYLDTNVLYQSWPVLSVATENILSIARKLGIGVIVPQPVLTELENQRRQAIENKLATASRVIREINSFLPNFTSSVTLPDWEQLTHEYSKRQSEIVQKWHLAVSPLPDIEIDVLYKHAVRRELVFGERGCNFQDVIIFLSMVQHLLSESVSSAALITNDGVFTQRERELSKYADKQGVSISIWKLTDAENELQNLLGSPATSGYLKRKRLASDAVGAALSDIARELQAVLNSAPNTGYREVNLAEVDQVDVPFEDEEATDHPVRLSAVLKGSMDVVVPSRYQASTSSFDERATMQARLFPEPTGRYPIELRAFLTAVFNGDSYRSIHLANFVF